MTIARRILVSGRVQGVFFRDWTVGEARALDVRGWVRNLADGRVEVLAAGDDAAVERLIAQLHEGPERARVGTVRVEDAADDGAEAFERR